MFWAAGAFFYFLYYFSVISAQDREPAESQNALNSVGLIKSAQLGSLSPGENQPQSVVVRSERCGFQQRAARCPISDQIANKAPQLGDEPEKHSKKKKKRKGFLCCSFAGGPTAELILAQGDFVQTLLEQGRPFEALPFGQNCVLFLILLIFSKLWLSKMTWQVFPVTVGPDST